MGLSYYKVLHNFTSVQGIRQTIPSRKCLLLPKPWEMLSYFLMHLLGFSPSTDSKEEGNVSSQPCKQELA